MANWRPPAKCSHDGVMTSFTETMAAKEAVDDNLLPNLRDDPELVLVSDYAGEHKASQFQVLGYLIADRPGILRQWDIERRDIRKNHLRDERRISFKGLGDARKQRALVPFLKSANSINGLLFCVAFDGCADSFASSVNWPKEQQMGEVRRPSWKPQVWDKLICVSLFGSVLVGGLSRPGQNLHWITDEDEIVANEDYQSHACQVLAGMLHHYSAGGLGQFRFGIAGKFNDERRAEDLISIVDLAAGAFAETLTSLSESRIPKSTNVFIPTPGKTSTKAELILGWLSDSTVPLKKIVCLVRPWTSGQFLVSFGSPELRINPPGRLWLPPDKGWRKSSESW